MPNPSLVSAVARSLLAADPDVQQIVSRLTHIFGHAWRWLPPLARRYSKMAAGHTRPSHRDVVDFLNRDEDFQRACIRHSGCLGIRHWIADPQEMQPVAAAASWDLPVIESVGDLANWLSIDLGDLAWFADLKFLGHRNRNPRLRHYHYRILSKNFDSIRLIEAPKSRLKQLQRQILSQILEKIPPHPAVHGFVKGRSIKSFVASHTGERAVLRMDLRDFFPSFAAARVQGLFRTLGYPDAVADFLGGICTTATPRDILRTYDVYSSPHLPQGAPTSPALANLCSYRLDCRLSGLAKAAGANYTRYADDLAFSGDQSFQRRVDRFSTHAAVIAMEEGFSVHHRKTRVMRQGVRQHLAGLSINAHANVMRPDFDRLKAILTNCVRHGPATQNREQHPAFREHLDGRIAFVEMINRGKGSRLRGIFEKIDWVEPT